VVDKGTHAAVRFNPAGYVTLNLGRRPEGPDEPDYYVPVRGGQAPAHIDGYFGGPTDVAFDSDDNIYVSDGYRNSRVAKFDKNGNWVMTWGSRGASGPQADQNPSQFNTLHNIVIDRQNNVYVVQDDFGRQDSGLDRRIGARLQTVQLDPRHRLPVRERAAGGRHEQLADPKGDTAPGTRQSDRQRSLTRLASARAWRHLCTRTPVSSTLDPAASSAILHESHRCLLFARSLT
jgi:hypothetical protein